MLQTTLPILNENEFASHNFRTRLMLLQSTSFCNINCEYCYLPSRHIKRRMPFSVLRQAIVRLVESGMLLDKASIAWHCGEPLAVGLEYMREAVRVAEDVLESSGKRDRVVWGIQTNGTLVTDQWAGFLAEYGFVTGISLDGPSFLHDARRKTRTGKGTHEAALRGLQMLKRNHVPLSAICVLSEDALAHAQQIHDFFAAHCEGMTVGFNIDEADGNNGKSSFSGTAESLRRFRDFFSELGRLTNESQAFRVRELSYFQRLILGHQSLKYTETDPFTIVSVSATGDVSTFSPEFLDQESPLYGSLNFGNVQTHSFADIAANERFRHVYRDVQRGISRCQAECDYFGVCGSTTLSNKLSENGTLDSTETHFCKYERKELVDVVLHQLETMST